MNGFRAIAGSCMIGAVLGAAAMAEGPAGDTGSMVLCMAFSPDGSKLLVGTGSEDGTCCWGTFTMFDVATSARLSFCKMESAPGGIFFSRDGKLYAHSDYSEAGIQVRLRNAETHQLVGEPVSAHKFADRLPLTFTPDGRRLIFVEIDYAEEEGAPWPGTMRTFYVNEWDIAAKRNRMLMKTDAWHGPTDEYHLVPCRFLVVSKANTIFLLDLVTGKVRYRKQFEEKILAAGGSPHSSTVAVAHSKKGKGRVIAFWDLARNKLLSEIAIEPFLQKWKAEQRPWALPDESWFDSVELTLSEDGERMLLVFTDDLFDGMCHLFDVTTGKHVRDVATSGRPCIVSSPHDLFITHDPRILLGDQPTVWDYQTGRKIAVVPGKEILSVAISPDGKKIATGNRLGQHKIHDLEELRKLEQLRKARAIKEREDPKKTAAPVPAKQVPDRSRGRRWRFRRW